MSKRDSQIKQYFDIDENGRLTPEHIPPSEPGRVRYPNDSGGVSLTMGLGVFLLFVAVLSFIFMLLFRGG